MKKLASAATAILLGVIMALSCLVTVSAATDTSISVDPNQKGSLTLTKYDSSTVAKDDNGEVQRNDDGTLKGTTDTNPTPVKGARFSLYKILAYGDSGYTLTGFTKEAIEKYNDAQTDDDKKIDLDEVVDSIVISNSEEPGGDGYATYGTTTYLESLMYIFQTYINSTGSVTVDGSLTTDDDGTGTADNLDLGVYFVNESLVPGGYIATTNSFLVSIPFWNKDKEGDNKWEYAVTAYPKDQPYENTVDKQIVDKDTEANTKKDTDSLSVGDTVSYQVKGEVPQYGKSVQNISTNLTEDRTIVTQEVYDKLPFVLTDELSAGLTYNGNLVVTVGANGETTLTQDTSATLVGGKVTWGSSGNYFVNFDKGTNTLTVIVKWDSINEYQGTPIVFTYDAVVDADAVVTDGNGNTAKISVANNPSTFNGDYSNITTKEYTSSVDTSTVYTYQFDLTKTFDGKKVSDFANYKPNASNVKFEICKNDIDKTPLKFFKTSDGTYTLWTGDYYTDTDSKIYAVVDVIAADGTKPTALGTAYTDATKYVLDGNVKAFANGTKADSELVTQIAVGSTGTLNVKGLENETYFLNEVSTADGYSVLSKPIEIVVTDVTAEVTIDTYYPFYATTEDDFDKINKEYYTKTEDTYTKITDFSSNLNKVVYLKDTKIISGTATSDVEAKVNGGEVLKEKATGTETSTGEIPITVNNAKNQFNLPITGGLGLWMFTIGGGVVMAGAIIFFSVIRKKKSKS